MNDVVLTLLIAKSKPAEKDTVCKVVVNLIKRGRHSNILQNVRMLFRSKAGSCNWLFGPRPDKWIDACDGEANNAPVWQRRQG